MDAIYMGWNRTTRRVVAGIVGVMAAALLAKDTTVIRNVPNLTDVSVMADVIRYLGAKVTLGNREVIIDASHINDVEAPYELVSQLRASFVVLGPPRSAALVLDAACGTGRAAPDGIASDSATRQQPLAYVRLPRPWITGARRYVSICKTDGVRRQRGRVAVCNSVGEVPKDDLFIGGHLDDAAVHPSR